MREGNGMDFPPLHCSAPDQTFHKKETTPYPEGLQLTFGAARLALKSMTLQLAKKTAINVQISSKILFPQVDLEITALKAI